MASRTEVRVTGFGGQGVVLFAHIVGRACAVHAGQHATMIQSFGPEARGSACTATLVISDAEVLYPYVRGIDLLVAMSSEGYDKYRDELRPTGFLLYENELVRPSLQAGQAGFGIPSTRIAESLGKKLVQNIVMLGAFAAVTGIVPVEAVRAAVKHSVPQGTEQLNLAAFERGLEHATGVLRVGAEAAP